jgi:hypothetical protein
MTDTRSRRAAFEARLKERLESKRNHESAGVAFLASIFLAYVQVMWDGTPVTETALAPYYARAGEHALAPSSWDTRADLMPGSGRAAARGQTNLAQLFIGILIAGIIAIRVFIPTIQDAIANSNVSGTTKTILDLLSLFAALLLLVSLAAPLMRRA